MGDATGNPASGLVGTDAPRVYQYVSGGGDDSGAADSCDADADGNDDSDDGGADDSGD
jgi:hypothetical protein